MSAAKISSVLAQKPSVVGTIHSPESLRRGLRLRPGEVDFLELRVDHFANAPQLLLASLRRLRFPLIVTVRDPREGGAHELSAARRRALFGEFLGAAALIDLELRSVPGLQDVLLEAKRRGIGVILSQHHFRRTPTPAQLAAAVARARAAGADICKIATRAERPADVAKLLTLFRIRGLPLSVMAMGAFGKASRLLLAQAGSILNYGYLDRPNASGQWEATTLRKRLNELSEI